MQLNIYFFSSSLLPLSYLELVVYVFLKSTLDSIFTSSMHTPKILISHSIVYNHFFFDFFFLSLFDRFSIFSSYNMIKRLVYYLYLIHNWRHFYAFSWFVLIYITLSSLVTLFIHLSIFISSAVLFYILFLVNYPILWTI